MRTGAWGWMIRASVAAAAATLVLVPMAVLLLLVHGNLWRLGVVTAPWWLSALLLLAVSPLAAVPGCLTSYVAGQSRRSRRLAAAASLAGGLTGGLLVSTSPVGLWVGMVLTSLVVVAWRDRTRPRVAVVPRAGEVDGGWASVEVEDLRLDVQGPRCRLVPRDVLEPAEGWEVPVMLPDRDHDRDREDATVTDRDAHRAVR